MKKYLAALLTVVLVFSLCIVGFADAESYGDDLTPDAETSVVVDTEKPAELEIQPKNPECNVCGKAEVYAKVLYSYEVGPYTEDCTHKLNGEDEVYYTCYVCADVCRSCGATSESWNRLGEQTRRVCHGW